MTLLAPNKFSVTTENPQELDSREIRPFNAIESVSYGFKAMYSRSRFLPWFTFSILAAALMIPSLLLTTPYLMESVRLGNDGAAIQMPLPDIWIYVLYGLALLWSIYAQAAILRGIIEGVRRGTPSISGIKLPVNNVAVNTYLFTLIELVVVMVAVLPALVATILAAASESIPLLLLGFVVSFALTAIASLFLTFGRQAIVDSGMGAFTAAMYSIKFVKNNFVQTLILVVLTGLISYFATLLLVLPLLFVLAPINIAVVHAYRFSGHGEIADLEAEEALS